MRVRVVGVDWMPESYVIDALLSVHADDLSALPSSEPFDLELYQIFIFMGLLYTNEL